MSTSAASGTMINFDHFNGNTYVLLEPSSWDAAQAEALAMGGNLVTINNLAENQFVYDTFRPMALSWSGTPATGKVNLWIGYNDLATEGAWVWVSGEQPDPLFQDWTPGQPQSHHDDDDYAGIRVRGRTASSPVGHWIDIVSDNRLGDLSFGVVELAGIMNPPQIPEPSGLVLATIAGATVLAHRGLRRRFRHTRAA